MVECIHETQIRVDEIPQMVAKFQRKPVVDPFAFCDR